MNQTLAKSNFNTTDLHRVTIIGSDLEASLPKDLPIYFRDGILIDRRNNTPMEMDGYSIYLALKALEKAYGTSYRAERKALVDAITRRMQARGGFWSHGAATGSEGEIHMRFTSAALRLLIEAFKDGLLADSSMIIEALRRHLSYSEPLNSGTWFLHDSFEKGGTTSRGWIWPIRNSVWGSSDTNCLVLNTHLDTLVTILQVLRCVDLNDGDRLYLVSQSRSGIAALKSALSSNSGYLWSYFASLDSAVRSLLFQTYSYPSLLAKVARKAFIWMYFRARRRLRSKLPGYVFPDGYLERDVGLYGTGFNYHVVNAWDLAKFVIQIKEYGFADADLFDTCERLIDRGLEYAIKSSYWCFLVASLKELRPDQRHTGASSARSGENWRQQPRSLVMTRSSSARLGPTLFLLTVGTSSAYGMGERW